jgi:hypothetical protein
MEDGDVMEDGDAIEASGGEMDADIEHGEARDVGDADVELAVDSDSPEDAAVAAEMQENDEMQEDDVVAAGELFELSLFECVLICFAADAETAVATAHEVSGEGHLALQNTDADVAATSHLTAQQCME